MGGVPLGGKKNIALKKVCERTEDGRTGIRGTLRGPRGPKKSVTDRPKLTINVDKQHAMVMTFIVSY